MSRSWPPTAFSVDKLVTDASPDDCDALLLPGGTVNPGQLRINPDAVAWPSPRDDLRNAGAQPVDEQVVVDDQFTTSRSPADLPAFCPAIVEQFAGAGAGLAAGLASTVPATPQFSTSEGDSCESSGVPRSP